MSLPETPLTRRETYLAKAAGQDVTLPETDLTREEQYLRAIAEGGGGGGTSPFYPAGNIEFANLPELSADILGAMYNVIDAFTTDSRFNEGAGVKYPAGTNVAVVNVGAAESPVLKYDTFAGAYVVDNALSDASENPVQNKVIKSALDGKATPADIAALINDTTAAQDKTYSSAKVEEKVEGEEITTTATGSDLTLSTSSGNVNALTVYGKSEVVDSAIVSEGDIGSIEIETCKKNLLDPTKLVTENITYTDGTLSGTAANFFLAYNQGIPILFNTTKQITLSLTAYKSGTFYEGFGLVIKFNYTDNTTDRLGIPNNTTTPQSFTLTSNPTKQIQNIAISYGDGSANIWYLSEIQLEYGSVATTYEPYNGTTATFSTGTPLRGIPDSDIRDVMAWDGSSGEVTKNCGEVDLGTLTWSYIEVSGLAPRFRTYALSSLIKAPINNDRIVNAICSKYQAYSGTNLKPAQSSITQGFAVESDGALYIKDTDYNDATTFKNAMNGVKLVYELTTPTTEQLTTAENASVAGLRTFTPQTHAQNNAGAEMTVEAYAGTANGQAVNELKQDVQSEISALKITQSGTLTLTAAGWSNNAQTITYAHDTAKRNVIDVDPSSVEEWANCGILATAETASGITFSCKTVPENALNFRVTSMGV